MSVSSHDACGECTRVSVSSSDDDGGRKEKRSRGRTAAVSTSSDSESEMTILRRRRMTTTTKGGKGTLPDGGGDAGRRRLGDERQGRLAEGLGKHEKGAGNQRTEATARQENRFTNVASSHGSISPITSPSLPPPLPPSPTFSASPPGTFYSRGGGIHNGKIRKPSMLGAEADLGAEGEIEAASVEGAEEAASVGLKIEAEVSDDDLRAVKDGGEALGNVQEAELLGGMEEMKCERKDVMVRVGGAR